MAKGKQKVIIKDISIERKKKAQKQKKPKIMVSGMSGLTKELACSVLTPFDCSACIPDGRTNSGCFTLKVNGQLSTGGTNGTCCGIAVCPVYNMGTYVDSANAAATTPTVTGNWSPISLSNIQNNYKAVRPVSCGLRLTFAGATQSDQGTILAGQLPVEQTLSSFNAAALTAFSGNCADYRVIPLRNGCEVIWRPESMDDMANWTAVNSTAAAVTTQTPIPAIVAWVYGANTNVVVCNYEVVINYEGQFSNVQYVPGGIKSAAKASVPTAEPGWYEKLRNVIDKVTPIAPLVGSALTAMTGNPLFTTLGSMANGMSYPGVQGRSSRRS